MTEVKAIPVTAAAKATHHSCDCCPIRTRAVCAYCDGPELEALEGLKAYRTYRAGQTVALAGEPMDFVASVMSGVATPTLSARLLEMTLDELDSAREWLLLLGRKSARERISSFLVILARREAALRGTAALGQTSFSLPLTREAMADYLGLTIETVSRQMTALRRDGVIALQGARQVSVPDLAALVLESGDDDDGGPLS